MEKVRKILISRNNVINDNNNYSNNVTNDNSSNGKKYALDRSRFKPNSEEALLAEELSSYFNDSENFAFYYSVVNRLGVMRTKEALADIKDEIKEKGNSKYPIRFPKKYFAWKYKRGLYR